MKNPSPHGAARHPPLEGEGLKATARDGASPSSLPWIRVRGATAGDADALACLAGQLGYPTDAEAVTRRLDEIVANDAGIVLIAVDPQGAVCGFAHARPERSVITEPFVDLAALVVAESARGAGVGKALLAAVEAWVRQQG
ncbi:MAG: GNAT family N-acetyltransferase, partial [Rhodanobacteraceae bacterium]